jgi:hypothetical protein
MRVLFVALLAIAGAAQVSTSRLQGVVQDQSGALIPGATISAVNEQTAQRAVAATDSLGFYAFPSLPPGEYTVTVEAAGFRKFVLSGVVLAVAATVTENFSLEIGQSADTLDVEAKELAVQISDAQVARVTALRDIEVLPQLERAPIILAIFLPGVQIAGGDIGLSRVNGTRRGSNNVKLDGVDVNEPVLPFLAVSATSTNPDSIREFRVATHNGKAEYGRSAGAQVELITRSGTNRWAGNLFDYHRNTAMNANNFFNNSSGVNRPKFIQNIFGGSLGGPVRRDRTFVFVNYQGRRARQEVVRNRQVLTPEIRSGLFRWRPPGGSAIQSHDIVRNDPRGKGIDPRMGELIRLLPAPNNFDVGDGLNTGGFRFNSPSHSEDNQFTIRVDHTLWSSFRLFYRFNWQRSPLIDSLNEEDAPFPGQPAGVLEPRLWGQALGADWTISPRAVNEFRYGRQSTSLEFFRPGRLPGPMYVPISFTSPVSTSFAGGRTTPVTELTDCVSVIRGRHFVKAGWNGRFLVMSSHDETGIYPNVFFGLGFGNVPPATVGPAGNISSADRQRFEQLYNQLLGRIAQVTQTFYSDLNQFLPPGVARIRNYAQRQYGWFFQDDWKIRRNLTLNLGLRYEFDGVPRERDGLQGRVLQAAQINSSSQIGDLTVERSDRWYKNDWNNLAPRIGVVWDPRGDGKTAIRAGYGIFYERLIGATTGFVDSYTPGFSQVVQVFPNSTAGSDWRASDAIPLPERPPAPVLRLPNARSGFLGLFRPDLGTGYAQQFNLTLQRELFRNTVLEAGYLGTRGVKLFMQVNPNQRKIYGDFLQSFREIQAFRSAGAPVPSSNTLVRLFGSASAAVSAIGASVFDQGAAGAAAETVDRNYYTRYASAGVSDFYLRNFPQYSVVAVGTNDGRSYYDSFQLSIRRQQGALKVDANYTWSKTIDVSSSDGESVTFVRPIDSFNLRLNRARADYDRPHVFSSSFLYTLPVGRNRRFGRNWAGGLDSVLGGWELGVLSIWESGSVFSAYSGRQTAAVDKQTYADYAGDRNIGGVDRRGSGVFWFTPAQVSGFTFPASGEIGTSGRNVFRGPRFFNVDTSLVKRFRFKERGATSLRAEAYNVFNNPNFANPDSTLLNPASFGRISATVSGTPGAPAGGTSGGPRILQLALRYEF